MLTHPPLQTSSFSKTPSSSPPSPLGAAEGAGATCRVQPACPSQPMVTVTGGKNPDPSFKPSQSPLL